MALGQTEEMKIMNCSFPMSLPLLKHHWEGTGSVLLIPANSVSFKLFGLDKTNDKAYERAIVLHAHHSIPATETYPYEISVSLGCPTVAPSFLGTLNDYISKSGKPILMWIYK
jgi:hypothetical protein